jgi:hypothetical protein
MILASELREFKDVLLRADVQNSIYSVEGMSEGRNEFLDETVFILEEHTVVCQKEKRGV